MPHLVLIVMGVLRTDPLIGDGVGFHALPLATPATSPSRLPHLATDAEGRIWLSWVAEQKAGASTTATLQLSRFGDDVWSGAIDVASGDRWFVNWADIPSVAVVDREHLVAHYLERSGKGPYDYHVKIVRSADAGRTWSPPSRLHADAGPGEHGFVSMVALEHGTAAAVWLDGRAAGGHGEATPQGAMRLYARGVASDGALGDEILLDERVCDCCPTDAVRARDGALVVAYRDRSADEVRDISLVRVEEGRVNRPGWSSSDGWKIAGCPVNGPALDVAGDRIGVAWFTLGSTGQSRVSCAFSKDGGRNFSAPQTLARENAGGRVDAAFDGEGRFVVCWMEAGENAKWRVARVDPDAGLELDVNTIVVTTGGRESGLSRLARCKEGMIFAWTEVGEEPRVAVRRLIWN